MNLDPGLLARIALCVLGLGVALALVRLALRTWRKPGASVGTAFAWMAGLAMLQLATATLLWFTLFPPMRPMRAETLVVLTARAASMSQQATAERVVALPEAPMRAGVERFADLGTALRRFPGTRRIRVFGAGLGARDRDAARDVVVEFVPAALPPGLVELRAPTQVAQGALWQVHGRIVGVKSAVVQLHDPADAIVARATIPRGGRFTLPALAGVPGRVEYTLRVMAGSRRFGADTRVPLEVIKGDRVRVLLLAAAPGPEIKYLRRWASDAGLDLRSEIRLGAGTALRTAGPASAVHSRFVDADLVVLDERAWRALGESGQDELLQSVRAGVGVLIRIASALTADDRAQLGRFGFDAPVPLPRVAATPSSDANTSRTAAVTLRPPGIAASDGIALRDPRDDAVLGIYRNEGRGRVGLWWAVDTYRKVLAGDASGHGALWSRTVAELARRGAATDPPAGIGVPMRVNERVAICSSDAQPEVIAPDGKRIALVTIRAATSASNQLCGAFWPRTRGWHVLRADGRSHSFHVRSAAEAPGLFADFDRELTLQLAALTAPRVQSTATWLPQQRWPWFLGWLVAASLLWWSERASTRIAGEAQPVADPRAG